MTGNTSLRTLLYQFVNGNPSLRTYYISLWMETLVYAL